MIAILLLLFLTAYIYVGYPLTLYILATFLSKPVLKDPSYTPPVTVIIPAHNEEKHIEEKILNTVELDYPAELLEIIIISDGSSDRTAEVAKETIARVIDRKKMNIKLIENTIRKGKAATMKEAVELSSGELIVFTDANAYLEKTALRNIARNFASPEVGCVCGELSFQTSRYSSATRGERLYWKYEHYLKLAESELCSMIGVNGAIYAVRRATFVPPPEDSISDDFMVALSTIDSGKRVIYEPEAKATEDMCFSSLDEFERKARIVAGGFQVLSRFPALFNPFASLTGFELFVHKFLRWLVPFNLAAIFILSCFHLRKKPVRWFFFMQLAFYLSPVIEIFYNFFHQLFSGKRDVKVRLAYIPFYFIMVNFAALVGLFRFLTGSQSVLWRKSRR